MRFLYPRPKKTYTHIVNCHVEGVKREENNIGLSSARVAYNNFQKVLVAFNGARSIAEKLQWHGQDQNSG